jgi:hypothetical protein
MVTSLHYSVSLETGVFYLQIVEVIVFLQCVYGDHFASFVCTVYCSSAQVLLVCVDLNTRGIQVIQYPPFLTTQLLFFLQRSCNQATTSRRRTQSSRTLQVYATDSEDDVAAQHVVPLDKLTDMTSTYSNSLLHCQRQGTTTRTSTW